jgi:hypothetical protein
MDLAVGGGMRRSASHTSLSESDDFDLSRLLNKPRINVERQRSFDDRSLSDVSHSGGYGGRGGFDGMYSPGGGLRSLLGTPASSALHSFDPHPIVGDAWEALRRSLVFFRGQPLGTIGAFDHASEEVLNYDQVCALTELSLYAHITLSSSDLAEHERGGGRCSSGISCPARWRS